MNYDYYGNFSSSYHTSGYDRDGARRLISRLFLALSAYMLISHTVIFLCNFITLLVLGRDAAIQILGDPYYIFGLQVIAMYLIALPIFLLLVNKMTGKATPSFVTGNDPFGIDEFAVLFFICTAALIFGGSISSAFTEMLSRILGHTVENSTSDLIANSPLWLVIAIAVIVGPIVEELIFRKVLIDRLSQFGVRYAIVVSAVSFGIFHGNFNQVFYATVLGLLLGYIYARSGRVIYSMVMHILINFFGTVPALIFGDSIDRVLNGTTGDDMALFFSDLTDIIGVIILQYGFAIAGAVLFLYFTFKKRYRLKISREIVIPRYDLTSVTLANGGVILYLLIVASEFVLSLI